MVEVLADVYVSEEDPGDDVADPYWMSGEPARVQVTSEDETAIRIGVLTDDRQYEVVGIYMSPSTARDLMVGLGAAIAEFEGSA